MAMSQTNDKAGPLRIVRRFARKMKKGGLNDGPVAEAAAPVAVKAKPLPSLNDVFAGGAARAAAQATIHPLDTLKVRMQATDKAPSVKARVVVGQAKANMSARVGAKAATLYKGVGSAAGGAGIAIGAYFAFYSAATTFLQEHSNMGVGAVAFAAGGFAAFSSSFVKVPLAVTIRSVQAGVYKNPLIAARAIVAKAGTRGLFTGLVPTVLEDIPDMAVKFAAYESLRNAHEILMGRRASTTEDLIMGGGSGALAAAATTPFDVVKTRMMCNAAQRPGIVTSAREVYGMGGGKAFFRGVGPRTLSNGINSALFFCLFEAMRRSLKARDEAAAARAHAKAPMVVHAVHVTGESRPMEASLSAAHAKRQ